MSFYKKIDYRYDNAAIFRIISNLEKLHAISTLSTEELNQILPYLETKPAHILIAILPPFYKSSIHRDIKPNGTFITKAINIPILHGDKVKMQWFLSLDLESSLSGPSGHYIPTIASGEIIEETTFDCPVIVNPSTYHNVENMHSETAYILSLRN